MGRHSCRRENHVHISNTLIAVGTKDVKAGCPQFGIRTAEVNGTRPTTITVSGGRIEARSTTSSNSGALINDTAAVQGNFRISPETVGAIGYQSDAISCPSAPARAASRSAPPRARIPLRWHGCSRPRSGAPSDQAAAYFVALPGQLRLEVSSGCAPVKAPAARVSPRNWNASQAVA